MPLWIVWQTSLPIASTLHCTPALRLRISINTHGNATESSEEGAVTGVSPLRLLLLCICTYRLHQSLSRLQSLCSLFYAKPAAPLHPLSRSLALVYLPVPQRFRRMRLPNLSHSACWDFCARLCPSFISTFLPRVQRFRSDRFPLKNIP